MRLRLAETEVANGERALSTLRRAEAEATSRNARALQESTGALARADADLLEQRGAGPSLIRQWKEARRCARALADAPRAEAEQATAARLSKALDVDELHRRRRGTTMDLERLTLLLKHLQEMDE